MSSRSLRVEDDAHDFFVKIILIGDSGVGKSNLISRFCDNKFTLQFNSTVGVEFTTKTLNMIDHGRPVMAQIWDTSGHTKARAITDAYYRGATGALLVYDVTRHITFVNTHKWLADLRNRAASDMVVMLVGNKSDVRQSVMVSTEAGKSFAEKESLCFMETSALRATNVEKAFVELVNEIYRNQINRKKDMEAHETMALSRSVSISSGNNEPAHYKLKIESFSLLSEAGIEKYESDVFEAGGYKWKLEVYPNGSEKELGNDHVSVYLLLICCHDMMMEKDWEVHVYFKILIYDHIRHNYLTIQGGDGQRTRFHEKKTRWGFRKLISLESFKDPENGYLFGDSCEFGAEVFVVPKYTQKDQCLSMMKPPVTMNTHVWTISKFTILKQQPLFSQDFKIGKVKWKLSLYPKGFKTGKNTNLSIFLRPHDVGSDEWKVYAKFKIQVKNQKDGGTHKSQEADHWFCKTAADGWGFPCFMLLSDLHDDKEGFLSNDTLIVEANIVIVGILKHLQ